MGRLWGILQRHIDESPYPPSEREVARKLGVSPTTLANWRNPKRLPSRASLQAIADLVGVRYATVLEAALQDTGYHEVGEYRLALRSAQGKVEVAEADLRDHDSRVSAGRMADDKDFRRRQFVEPLERAKAELAALQEPDAQGNIGA